MLVPNHPHPSFSSFLSFPFPFFLLFPLFLFPPLQSKGSDGKEPGRFTWIPSDKGSRDGLEGTSRVYTFGYMLGLPGYVEGSSLLTGLTFRSLMQLHYIGDILKFCGLSLHGRWIFRHQGSSFALS